MECVDFIYDSCLARDGAVVIVQPSWTNNSQLDSVCLFLFSSDKENLLLVVIVLLYNLIRQYLYCAVDRFIYTYICVPNQSCTNWKTVYSTIFGSYLCAVPYQNFWCKADLYCPVYRSGPFAEPIRPSLHFSFFVIKKCLLREKIKFKYSRTSQGTWHWLEHKKLNSQRSKITPYTSSTSILEGKQTSRLSLCRESRQ